MENKKEIDEMMELWQQVNNCVAYTQKQVFKYVPMETVMIEIFRSVAMKRSLQMMADTLTGCASDEQLKGLDQQMDAFFKGNLDPMNTEKEHDQRCDIITNP